MTRKGKTDLVGLKERVEVLRAERNKAEGMLQHLKRELREKHGCDSLMSAKERLSRLVHKERKYKRQLAEAVAKFEKRWRSQLELLGD